MSTRVVLAAALAAVLAACSADRPKPTPLEPFTGQLAAKAVWNARVENVRFPLVVAVNGGTVTLAGGDSVVALQADSGREQWRAGVGARIAAGVGSDGRYTSVVTVDNELVTLEGGSVKWRQRLTSRVATPPLVAGERVFVMGVDRVVHAFDVIDGRRIWNLQRAGDPLTLSQPGVVAAFKDTLLVGQGPRLVGVDPLQGTVRWEIPLASPRGTNEVERLADLVGPALRLGDQVCARAFQSAIGCANLARATLGWTKNVGGINAIGGDAELIFGADGADRVSAWRTASGEIAWTTERLLYRGLAAPLALPKAVLFGDVEGQLHFLSRTDGQTLQRVATDGSGIVAPPVLVAGMVVAVTRNGGVYGVRVD